MKLRPILMEAAVVLAGAVLAALVIRQVPGLRSWIAQAWADTPGGCSCNDK